MIMCAKSVFSDTLLTTMTIFLRSWYSCTARDISGTTTTLSTVSPPGHLTFHTFQADMHPDGLPLLQNLQIPYIISQGYTNLRCVWTLGCPAELHLSDVPQEMPEDPRAAKTTEIAYPAAFHELFPGEPLPTVVGVACCAQFAVTRQQMRERPLTDYHRFRTWVTETTLDDYISGRVMEYSWHVIFGREPVHCPNARECYCKTYGLCELECTEEGKCGDRWPFPPYATLPNGWPEVGWGGEIRSQEQLEELKRTAMVGNVTMT